MKNWIKGAWCALKGHKVVKGATCPVTGVQLLSCTKCGKDIADEIINFMQNI